MTLYDIHGALDVVLLHVLLVDNDPWDDKEIAFVDIAAGDFTGSPIAVNLQHKLSKAIGDVEILQKKWDLFLETSLRC